MAHPPLFNSDNGESHSNETTISKDMKFDSLQHLFVHELKDLYSAENQIVKALSRMADTATCPDLRRAFLHHLDETRNHVRRLEEIFGDLDFQPSNLYGDGVEAILLEGDHLIEGEADGPVRDAGLILCAQRIEHYEMAGYGGAIALAEVLGPPLALKNLRLTLEEEGEADRNLSHLSETVILAGAAPASVD